MDMLRITNLKKHFGDKEVLTGLNLSVPEHSVFGFVGENGAGKTTTMKIILGLLKSDRGEVFVSGERVKYGQTATNRYIGYLPDVPEFYSFAVTYGYNAFFWDNSIAVGLLPAMVHWWLFGVWIIGLIVLFSVLVKSYTGVLLGTGGSVLGVYLISFFPKAWKYTPTTLMESASLLIGTKSIEDYGIAVLITILLVVICLIVSITVMNRKQL